jgi:hypothetical protein
MNPDNTQELLDLINQNDNLLKQNELLRKQLKPTVTYPQHHRDTIIAAKVVMDYEALPISNFPYEQATTLTLNTLLNTARKFDYFNGSKNTLCTAFRHRQYWMIMQSITWDNK